MTEKFEGITDEHAEVLEKKTPYLMDVHEIICLAYTVKDRLQSKMNPHGVFDYREADAHFTAFFTCQKALSRMKRVASGDKVMKEKHGDLLSFFDKDIRVSEVRGTGENEYILEWMEEKPEVKKVRENLGLLNMEELKEVAKDCEDQIQANQFMVANFSSRKHEKKCCDAGTPF